jgi:hypothetical protein
MTYYFLGIPQNDDLASESLLVLWNKFFRILFPQLIIFRGRHTKLFHIRNRISSSLRKHFCNTSQQSTISSPQLWKKLALHMHISIFAITVFSAACNFWKKCCSATAYTLFLNQPRKCKLKNCRTAIADLHYWTSTILQLSARFWSIGI